MSDMKRALKKVISTAEEALAALAAGKDDEAAALIADVSTAAQNAEFLIDDHAREIREIR